ncbi:MAG: LysR family transcriptional regulator [Burkholderiaceae bacterium]|nr:LysR family transcriptional regulator [Burkholderiaceae bacterium]
MLPKVFLYVDAIARAGSIRKAAETVHVAASALNRQLRELEESLGVELFERLPRGMRPTGAGEMLLAHIRDQKRDFDLLRWRLEEMRGLRRAHVRISAHESATRDLLSNAVVRFRESHPKVSFTVVNGTTERTFHELLEDESELGLLFHPPANAMLTRLDEVTAPLQAVMSRRHPLADRRHLWLSDCLAHPYVLTYPGNPTAGSRVLIEALAQRAGMTLSPSLESNSFELMARFAQSGNGIFFQIAAGVQAEVERGDLVAIPLRDPVLASARLVLLARRGRTLSVAASRFAQLVGSLMHDTAAE